MKRRLPQTFKHTTQNEFIFRLPLSYWEVFPKKGIPTRRSDNNFLVTWPTAWSGPGLRESESKSELEIAYTQRTSESECQIFRARWSVPWGGGLCARGRRGLCLGVGMGRSACKWLRQCACLWHICVPNTRKRFGEGFCIHRKGCAASAGADEWGRKGMVRYGEKQVIELAIEAIGLRS